MTMDEVDTYFWYVATSRIWNPFPNNHVLNTLLMWIATRAFGISSMALRSPALLGATLYVSVCYFLCRVIVDRFSIQLALLVCLVYNPFILDYMVAARGYGLADAFLFTAIAVPVWHLAKNRSSLCQSCALASLALGLSFAANFTFFFVDLWAFLALAIWAIGRRDTQSAPRILAYCILPGLGLVLLLCGYTLVHWKRDDLIWGATSLRDMTQSLLDSSLYRLNPQFQETVWYQPVNSLAPWLIPLLSLLCVFHVVATKLDGSWSANNQTRWLGKWASAIGCILTLSIFTHWLAFRVDHLLLPVGRTGLFLIPLTTLLAGAIAAVPTRSLVSLWLRRSITAVFFCLAGYFLLCLRISYFREYQWDADAKNVYSVLARFNHTYGVKEVGMTGLFCPALNYYRMLSKGETLSEFRLESPNPPPGKSIYVMSESVEQNFISKEKLVIVYRGNFTDVIVAVRPGTTFIPALLDRGPRSLPSR